MQKPSNSDSLIKGMQDQEIKKEKNCRENQVLIAESTSGEVRKPNWTEIHFHQEIKSQDEPQDGIAFQALSQNQKNIVCYCRILNCTSRCRCRLMGRKCTVICKCCDCKNRQNKYDRSLPIKPSQYEISMIREDPNQIDSSISSQLLFQQPFSQFPQLFPQKKNQQNSNSIISDQQHHKSQEDSLNEVDQSQDSSEGQFKKIFHSILKTNGLKISKKEIKQRKKTSKSVEKTILDNRQGCNCKKNLCLVPRKNSKSQNTCRCKLNNQVCTNQCKCYPCKNNKPFLSAGQKNRSPKQQFGGSDAQSVSSYRFEPFLLKTKQDIQKLEQKNQKVQQETGESSPNNYSEQQKPDPTKKQSPYQTSQLIKEEKENEKDESKDIFFESSYSNNYSFYQFDSSSGFFQGKKQNQK